MNAIPRWALYLALVTVLVTPLLVARQAGTNDSSVRQILSQEWPVTGGYLQGSHYSPLAQINTQNVKNLGAAWISQSYEDAAASRVTPVVKDHMIFITAGAKVYAFSARTGEKVWTYQT